MRVPPTSRGAPFPPPSSRGGILSLRGRERNSSVPVESQEEALSTGMARGTPGSCHHSQSPSDVSVHSGKYFSLLGSTFKPRIDSHHGDTWDSPVGKPRGNASCESLVGKPRGKATDPLILSKGSSTLLLQLGGKCTCMPPLETRTDYPEESPEVPQDPRQPCRGILTFRHRLQTRS